MQVMTRLPARIRAQAKLVETLKSMHRQRPYDLVYQFSQPELFGLRAMLGVIPIVVHPEAHAKGELRWLIREKELVRQCEPLGRRLFAYSYLTLRSAIQRVDLRDASMVVAPSRHFAEHLRRDCDIDRTNLVVVPNPVDLERFQTGPPRPTGKPLRLLYMSRLSVRKGLEMVLELTHQLSDLEGLVEIHILGDKTLWSDYRPLLRGLNPRIGRYLGQVTDAEAASVYRQADCLLQPSHYEPFAMTVAEALASGIPVVASEEVGASEWIDRRVCRVFRQGDSGEFEVEVRQMISDLQLGRAPLAALARKEAETHFARDVVSNNLVGRLHDLVNGARA
jgi:glycosyltransferase involved in cell wall biosynthesis